MLQVQLVRCNTGELACKSVGLMLIIIEKKVRVCVFSYSLDHFLLYGVSTLSTPILATFFSAGKTIILFFLIELIKKSSFIIY